MTGTSLTPAASCSTLAKSISVDVRTEPRHYSLGTQELASIYRRVSCQIRVLVHQRTQEPIGSEGFRAYATSSFHRIDRSNKEQQEKAERKFGTADRISHAARLVKGK
jgi:hypothetical protein